LRVAALYLDHLRRERVRHQIIVGRTASFLRPERPPAEREVRRTTHRSFRKPQAAAVASSAVAGTPCSAVARRSADPEDSGAIDGHLARDFVDQRFEQRDVVALAGDRRATARAGISATTSANGPTVSGT
jgi:hypothetical protein